MLLWKWQRADTTCGPGAQLQMLVWCRVLAPIQAARIAVQTIPAYKLDTLTFLKCAPMLVVPGVLCRHMAAYQAISAPSFTANITLRVWNINQTLFTLALLAQRAGGRPKRLVGIGATGAGASPGRRRTAAGATSSMPDRLARRDRKAESAAC